MKRAIVTATAALVLVGCVQASASPKTEPTRFGATLICPRGLAEDSASNVRLVRYDPQPDGSVVLVYRCMRFGY